MLLQEAIKVFPNPNNGYFEIESLMSIQKISVYNAFGSKVFETNPNDVKVAIQIKDAGLLILLIHLDGQIITKKVIVQ